MAVVPPGTISLSQNFGHLDLLGGMPGWEADSSPPRTLRDGPRRFSLRPLARLGPLRALICEAALRDPLPDYPLRRALARRLRRGAPGSLVLFADASHLAQVWSWDATCPGGVRVYRERRVTPGEPERTRRTALSAATAELTRTQSTPGPSGATRRAVLSALNRALRREHGPLPPRSARGRGIGCLVERIEESDDPRFLRSLWRALVGDGRLAGLAVLDPACGDGDWLLEVMATLEPVYHTCIERMRAWLGELPAHPRPRPERMRDFRRILDAADDPSRFVRAAIARHNLYGLDLREAALARCRARFTKRARADELNLSLGTLAGGIHSVTDLERALTGRTGGALERIREEFAIVEAVTRIPGAETGPHPELARRRARLHAELDALLPAATIPRAHTLALWPTLAARGGFDLVRGARP